MKHTLIMLLKVPQTTKTTSPSVPFSRLYVSHLLAAFEQEEWRTTPESAASPHSDQVALQLPQGAIRRVPIEPLSQQEQRVLQLLVAGQTYAEIAEKLIVSPNTIKTQINSIYRKLGVSRRAEAIAVTTHLHLL